MSPTIEDIIEVHFGMSRLELGLIICARNFYLRHGIGTMTWKLEFNCLEGVLVSIDKDEEYRCVLTVRKITPGYTTVSTREVFHYPLYIPIFRRAFCRMAQCTLEL